MGYKFSLMLSREINDEETTVLREAGCSAASFTTDSHPTSAEITITKIDVDDTLSSTLAEAIEAALEVVKKVPDLSVPGLTVPAQPNGTAPDGTAPDGTAPDGTAPDGTAPDGTAPDEATAKDEPGTESPE